MKLQPNFSWQKYEGKPEDQKEQFQKQLQTEHTLVANTTNSTIDDISFWTRERQTAFTFVNGKPIFTFTLPTNAWTAVGTVNTIIFPITGNFTVIDFVSTLTHGNISIPIPHVNPGASTNSVGLTRVGTTITLFSGGADFTAYSGYVTLYYYKF